MRAVYIFLFMLFVYLFVSAPGTLFRVGLAEPYSQMYV